MKLQKFLPLLLFSAVINGMVNPQTKSLEAQPSSSLIDTALESMHGHRSPSLEELEDAASILQHGSQARSLSTSQFLLSQPLSTEEYSQYQATFRGELLSKESSHVPILEEEKYCINVALQCLDAKPPRTQPAIAILYPLYIRHQQNSLGALLMLNIGNAYLKENNIVAGVGCLTLAATHPNAPVTNFIARQRLVKLEKQLRPQ